MTQVNTDYPGTVNFADVPFSAGDFTGNNSMSWTVIAGGVGHYRWAQQGSLLNLSLRIGGTVGGTPSTGLRVKLPNGLKAKNSVSFICTVNSFGTGFQFGFGNITAGGDMINFQLSLATPFANWGAGAAEVNFLGALETQ